MFNTIPLTFDELSQKLYEVREHDKAPLLVGELMRDRLGYATGNFTYHFAGRRAEPSTFQPQFWWGDGAVLDDTNVRKFREGPFREGQVDDQPHLIFEPYADRRGIVFSKRTEWEKDRHVVLVPDGEVSFRSIQYWLHYNTSRKQAPDEDAIQGYLDLLGLSKSSPRFVRLVDWIRQWIPAAVTAFESRSPTTLLTLAETELIQFGKETVFGVNMAGHISFRMVRLPRPEEEPWLPPSLRRAGHPGLGNESHLDTPETDRSALVVPMKLRLEEGDEHVQFRMIYYGSHIGISPRIEGLRTNGLEWMEVFERSIDAVALSFMSGKIFQHERSQRIVVSEVVGHEFKNIITEIDPEDLLEGLVAPTGLTEEFRAKLRAKLSMMLIPQALGTFLRTVGKFQVTRDAFLLRQDRLDSTLLSDEAPESFSFRSADVTAWTTSIANLYRFIFGAFEVPRLHLVRGMPGSPGFDPTPLAPMLNPFTMAKFPPVDDEKVRYELRFAIVSLLIEPLRNALRYTRQWLRDDPSRKELTIYWNVETTNNAQVIAVDVYNPLRHPNDGGDSSGVLLVDHLAQFLQFGHCWPTTDTSGFSRTCIRCYPQYLGLGPGAVPHDFLKDYRDSHSLKEKMANAKGENNTRTRS